MEGGQKGRGRKTIGIKQEVDSTLWVLEVTKVPSLGTLNLHWTLRLSLAVKGLLDMPAESKPDIKMKDREL